MENGERPGQAATSRFKRITARALANYVLPALADALSIAGVAPHDLSLATELLNVQLKLHLLTTEHLVSSHGFDLLGILYPPYGRH
jgi:hypothetical protein